MRYVHVMSHPNWPSLVRVGRWCAKRMGDPYAIQREREFKRNPDKWRMLGANGALIDNERGTVGNLLRHFWTESRREEWLSTFIWILVILVVLVYLNRP